MSVNYAVRCTVHVSVRYSLFFLMDIGVSKVTFWLGHHVTHTRDWLITDKGEFDNVRVKLGADKQREIVYLCIVLG